MQPHTLNSLFLRLKGKHPITEVVPRGLAQGTTLLGQLTLQQTLLQVVREPIGRKATAFKSQRSRGQDGKFCPTICALKRETLGKNFSFQRESI